MPSNPLVVVLGSANADLVLDVRRLPLPGETLMATGRRAAPGGKGANQAVAVARDGRACSMLASVGRDADGDLLLAALADAGVATALVRRTDTATGLAVILVDDSGQNSIVVAAGANAELTVLTDPERQLLTGAAVLLCQLEVPVDTVVEALAVARRGAVLTVLNAAPSSALPDRIWPDLDVLVVNEHEASDLAGVELDPGARAHDPFHSAELLLARVPQVVVTLGAEGVAYAARDGRREHMAAPRVPVVDTTGAGDTFCGVLAAALAGGADVRAALRRAVTAAALSVQASGALPSIPTAADTDRHLPAR